MSWSARDLAPCFVSPCDSARGSFCVGLVAIDLRFLRHLGVGLVLGLFQSRRLRRDLGRGALDGTRPLLGRWLLRRLIGRRRLAKRLGLLVLRRPVDLFRAFRARRVGRRFFVRLLLLLWPAAFPWALFLGLFFRGLFLLGLRLWRRLGGGGGGSTMTSTGVSWVRVSRGSKMASRITSSMKIAAWTAKQIPKTNTNRPRRGAASRDGSIIRSYGFGFQTHVDIRWVGLRDALQRWMRARFSSPGRTAASRRRLPQARRRRQSGPRALGEK